MTRTEARPHPLRLHANHVSVGKSGDEYFQISFDSDASSDDDFDLSGSDRPYLVIQRQFEDDDSGVCYIETHDHDTYTGHFRLRLIEFTPTRLAFEIALDLRSAPPAVTLGANAPRDACELALIASVDCLIGKTQLGDDLGISSLCTFKA
jgi:hypothetical protein